MKTFKHKQKHLMLGDLLCTIRQGGWVTSLYAIDLIIRKIIWLPEPCTVI